MGNYTGDQDERNYNENERTDINIDKLGFCSGRYPYVANRNAGGGIYVPVHGITLRWILAVPPNAYESKFWI